MRSITLAAAFLVIVAPSCAARTISDTSVDDASDPNKALVDILQPPQKDISSNACTIGATIDFDLYRSKLSIFRDAWLNRDYSIDFYAQRGRQVLAFVVAKHAAELITEGLYNGHEMPKCSFSMSIAYRDKFGQPQKMRILTWSFNNEQAHKVDWEKFDPKDFNEVALNYQLDKDVGKWIGDEPVMGQTNSAASSEEACNMFMFKANAIFIRATTFCRKDYMDSKAGLAALSEARKCIGTMKEAEIKPQASAAMRILDQAVRERGRVAACAMVEDIARNVNSKSR